MNAPLQHDLALQAPAWTPEEQQRRLSVFNRGRLLPALPASGWRSALADEMELRIEELQFLAAEREAVIERAAAAPTDPDGFIAWFEALRSDGPGQGDPLFDWLAEAAPMEAMRWFVQQEVAGEAGFDDLVALTQLRLPLQPKLELARNYWDEMGRGKKPGMHGPMLELTVRELGVTASLDATVWESLALGNVMAGLAANRCYAYHSIGALGAVELTAPSRVSLVNAGLERLGVSSAGRRYFQLHAGLDVLHSAAWNREAIRPLVAADPRHATAIAEGALMRLDCGARCFERYRAELMH